MTYRVVPCVIKYLDNVMYVTNYTGKISLLLTKANYVNYQLTSSSYRIDGAQYIIAAQKKSKIACRLHIADAYMMVDCWSGYAKRTGDSNSRS